ncbi:adenylate/guanylate cyclase domain-containing protein, partial [Thermodesulfobacteriota bacterium]
MTEDFKRKLTAILSADVVGYSRLMGDDEAATVKTLETYKGVMSSLIKQHRGRVVDSPGDNLLAEFGSVVDAVQCSVSIQKELQSRNTDLPENRRMEFRIGINLGDVIEEEDRIYGDGVNIAARLEALADPGGICVSKTAFDHIESKLPLGYEFLGDQTVKNIAKPVGAYKVLMETRVVDTKTKREDKVVSFWRRKAVLSIGIIVILAIVAVLYWNFYLREASNEASTTKFEQETIVPEVKEALKTIAVLPFDDLSPDKDQEYFVDGLSEEILNAIDQIPGLTVKARTSSFSFKDQNKNIQEIAGLLGVDHILQGSVRKAGDTLRITTRLIKVADVSSLWSETYERELKDIFEIQEDIAKNVAGKLKLTLEAFNLVGGTDNVEA